MATAFILPAHQPQLPTLCVPAPPLRNISPGERGREAKVSAIVHVIHPNRNAALALAREWTWEGVRPHVHASTAEFMKLRDQGLPSCLVLHFDRTRPSSVDDDQIPRTRLPVIVTADHADIRTAVLAMKAGAIDFFETPLCNQDIVDAIDAALDSDRLRRAAEAKQAAALGRYATLTRREKEVMGLVTRGLLNKQVAGDLGLSEITVKVHRGAVMRKMEARTLADLVRMADLLETASGFADRAASL